MKNRRAITGRVEINMDEEVEPTITEYQAPTRINQTLDAG